MNFHLKVVNLINRFYMANGYKPNELFLGFQEEFELDKYIESFPYTINNLKIEKPAIRDFRKLEFLGLKVRFVDENNLLELKYNPHYQ